jgi:hypothetical protein
MVVQDIETRQINANEQGRLDAQINLGEFVFYKKTL